MQKTASFIILKISEPFNVDLSISIQTALGTSGSL